MSNKPFLVNRFDLKQKLLSHMGFGLYNYGSKDAMRLEQVLDYLELAGFVKYESCETECLTPVIKHLYKTLKNQK